MAAFLSDPSVLTKDKLKSALLANNVTLPNGEQKKGVYVELYLKNLTSQNQNQRADVFSSDEETPPSSAAKSRSGSGRKATKKTDRVCPEEIDVTLLTDEALKDQLLKYGVNAGPIVASTRKVYEKKLQTFLDQGPPESIVSLSEAAHTDSSQNGNTDSDQYSDKEEEAAAVVLESEPMAEPEPVPVVERPSRSRGKTPNTTRMRSNQHKEKKNDQLEEDFQTFNVQRKRRSTHRLDQMVPASDDTFYEGIHLPVKDPPPSTASSPWKQGRKLSEIGGASCAALHASPSDEPRSSVIDTALIEVCPDSDVILSSQSLTSGPRPKAVVLNKHTRQSAQLQSSSPMSKDLIHTMCQLSPSPASEDSPCLLSPGDHQPAKSIVKEQSGSSPALPKGKQSKISRFLSPVTLFPVSKPDVGFRDQGVGVMIEKLSAVEQTPKTTEKDVLKEMFPSETLNTPTGISATCRQPIKGAAGRSFNSTFLDDLRPRLTELRKTTSSSYIESRAVPRVSAVPLSASKLSAPPSVQVKARRRLPVWGQLLLVVIVAAFLFLVYQAMESNEMSPFGQPSSTALDSTSK